MLYVPPSPSRVLCSLLLAALACVPAWAEEPEGPPRGEEEKPAEIPPPPEDALKTIKTTDAKKYLKFLAGKKCKGRASGLPGCDLAGEYLVERLTEWKYEPKGDEGGYKQPFNVTLLAFKGQPPPRDVELGTKSPTFNVVGVLEGSDEKLKEEYVVLTAHYDHTGPRSKRKYYAGADDNASGTTALLEVAQAFTAVPSAQPKRSVMILFVTGEERGLLGSKYFVSRPTVPISSIVCDLNLDMVGRNKKDPVHVYGNGCSADLDTAHRKAIEVSGLDFIAKTGSIFLRSDQASFYEAGIPALFWTTGLHSDYHRTGDTSDKIAYKRLVQVAKHAFATVWEIANRPKRPNYVKMTAEASAGRLGAVLVMIAPEEVPRAKLKGGQGVVLVSTVLEKMPAHEAKVKDGDLIIGVGGKDLSDTDPVGSVENAAEKAKKKLSLRIVRGSKRIKITVKF